MSRTTVEDCMEKCDNRFNLVCHVAARARDIQHRGDARVSEHDDKTIVVALREVAEGLAEISPFVPGDPPPGDPPPGD